MKPLTTLKLLLIVGVFAYALARHAAFASFVY